MNYGSAKPHLFDNGERIVSGCPIHNDVLDCLTALIQNTLDGVPDEGLGIATDGDN